MQTILKGGGYSKSFPLSCISLLSVGTLETDNDTTSITEPSSAPDGWGESSQNVTGCTIHCQQKNDSKIEVEPPESNTHSKYLSDIVSRQCRNGAGMFISLTYKMTHISQTRLLYTPLKYNIFACA